MSDLHEVSARMKEDWNARAREDANYYVAFGRRGQDSSEFFETGAEVVRGLTRELRRLPASHPRARRGLEIGCGPGRLLLPLSRYFGEIHGVDVSDEMIARARENLRGIPHAHVHAGSGADLSQFADSSFDLVYSYAVFQHIPSAEVIWSYLREARRVLKPGGVLRCQVNGLPDTGRSADTWQGAPISADELRAFSLENDLQLLELDGAATQYLWFTMLKRAPGWREQIIAPASAPAAAIRRITNADGSEPFAPAAGRYAAISLWVEGLPPAADLHSLEVRFRTRPGVTTYIGPPDPSDGLVQVNAFLPDGLATGLAPVELLLAGHLLTPPALLRILPQPPQVPRVLSVSDGVDLLSGPRIVSGYVKVTIGEAPSLDGLSARLDDAPLTDLAVFLADPRQPRHEVNLRLPDTVAKGPHRVSIALARRFLGEFAIEVA